MRGKPPPASHLCLPLRELLGWGCIASVDAFLNDQDFSSGRLNDIISEFMEKSRNVNDWVSSKTDFSQLMVKPTPCGRCSISECWLLTPLRSCPG